MAQGNILYSIKSLLRDSFGGEIVYRISGRRFCKPEFEKNSYVIPKKYLVKVSPSNGSIGESSAKSESTDEKETSEKQIQANNSTSNPDERYIMVDWDGPDDLANPYNWPVFKKTIVAIVMALITASLYMGSALFTPAEAQLVVHFDTSVTKVTLGLSLFVWGYGLASLWFSPMSESPFFGGRNYIYLFCQFFFAILQIPTALSNHIAPFAVLRLLAGFMAAPPLSTGGATFNDIFRFPHVVYALIIWSVGGIMGPCIGPLIGGALVQHNSWRWAFWYLLIQASAVLGLMIFLFPETSSQAILMRKARSLRRRTGNPNIMAPGDIEKRALKTSVLLKRIFWNPIKLTIREPVLLLINIHLGLMYAIMYLYFEAVPISYGQIYHFNYVQQGLSYVSVLVGCYLMAAFYIPYLHFWLIKPSLGGRQIDPYGIFGNAAILSAIMPPIGILIFGWTSFDGCHWIVSMIGNAIFGAAIWLMFQSYLSFLSNLYPPSQIASAFASNSVARAVLAAAFPLFARAMYNHTAIEGFPVGWGSSILAFISIPLIGLPIYMRLKGEHLHELALQKYGPN